MILFASRPERASRPLGAISLLLAALLAFTSCAGTPHAPLQQGHPDHRARYLTFPAGTVVLTTNTRVIQLVCAHPDARGCYEPATLTLYCIYTEWETCWHEFLHHAGILDRGHQLRYERMQLLSTASTSSTSASDLPTSFPPSFSLIPLSLP